MRDPSLLDHPPVQRALADPSTRYWLRDIVMSAASRDPVDVLADLEAARDLVASYVQKLLGPIAGFPQHDKPDGR